MAEITMGFKRRKKETFDEIYVQDFGDDYHHSKDHQEELLKKARSILSLYYNPNDYNEANEIYEEYMDELIAKYGGKKRFKLLKQAKRIYDFIPNKPKLKMTESTKLYLKYGILNSKFMEKLPASLRKECSQKSLEYMEDEMQEDRGVNISEGIKKCNDLETMMCKNLMEENKNNRAGGRSRTGLLESYFEYELQDNDDSVYDSYGNVKYKLPSILDLMREDYDPEEYDVPLTKYDDEDSQFVNLNGRLVTKQQHEEYIQVQTLKQLGWNNSFIVNNLGLGKESAIASLIKSESRLSKKEKKRAKKKRKKIKEGAEDAMLNIVNKTMGLDFNSYSEFEEEMLRMEAPNIF